jgi:hypothetical protein
VIRSYASYLGGEQDDRAHDVTVDAQGNAYVAGWTESELFPTRDGIQPGNNNDNDEAFVTKFNADGSGLVWSTYLGGGVGSIFFGEGIDVCGGEEGAYGVAVDNANNVYVTGYTFSRDFPTRNAMQPNLAEENCDGDSFITKLNPAGNQLVFSTYYGGVDGADIGRGIAVDTNQNVYVVGYTNSPFFPTTNPIQGQIDRRLGRATNGRQRWDAYLSKIDASGQFRVYSTYIGGDQDDVGLDVAVDAEGNAYVTGWTESTLPVPGPLGEFVPGALYATDGAARAASNLYILDPTDGSILQTVGPIGFGITGLAFDSTTGALYGTVSSSRDRNNLAVIDPSTGAGTLIGGFVNAGSVADLAADASGKLFGWAQENGAGGNVDELYAIDKQTGFATRVGPSGLDTFGSGMAFDAGGTLYLAGNGANGPLSIINPATGQATAGRR